MLGNGLVLVVSTLNCCLTAPGETQNVPGALAVFGLCTQPSPAHLPRSEKLESPILIRLGKGQRLNPQFSGKSVAF